MHRAMARGVDLRGCQVWSLMQPPLSIPRTVS
nr:hypothetical protein [Cryobacterium adonitolivorans]